MLKKIIATYIESGIWSDFKVAESRGMWFEGVSDRGWIRVLTLFGHFRVFYARVVEVVKELTQDGVILFFSELPCKSAVWDVVQVLQPFEIGNSDTTSIQIQIWNDQAFVGNQDLVTSWSNWTISTFGDDLGFDIAGVIGSDDLEEMLLSHTSIYQSTFSLAQAPRISHWISIRGPLAAESHASAPGKPTIVPLAIL